MLLNWIKIYVLFDCLLTKCVDISNKNTTINNMCLTKGNVNNQNKILHLTQNFDNSINSKYHLS